MIKVRFNKVFWVMEFVAIIVLTIHLISTITDNSAQIADAKELYDIVFPLERKDIPSVSEETVTSVSLTATDEIVVEEETTNTIYPISVSEEDIDLMARVVMSESSILSYDAKVAVAYTIVARTLSNKFPNTIKEVIYQPNQYSTADNGEPNEDCYLAVYNALEEECFPIDMFYFRTDYPHSFGYPYCHIGNTYFSTESEYLTEIE